MRLFCFCFFFSLLKIGNAQVLEAESGTKLGTQTSTSRAGYSGAGYVTGFDADGDKVTMTANTTEGVYNIYMRYASPSGDKFNFVYINDQNIGSVAFPLSASFTEALAGKFYLRNGVNSIAIVKDWGYVDLDNIRLEKTIPSDFNKIATTLVTPSPSDEADSLYAFLSKVYGKVILSGQFGGSAEFNKINMVSGKTPIIHGFDLIDYSPSRVEHGATSAETEKSITWHEENGIVTFCWHWNAPKNLIDQPGKEWWRGFYTDG